MNKEKRHFKKITKQRKAKAGKRKNESFQKIANIRKQAGIKKEMLELVKDRSANILEYRRNLFESIRAELDIPDNINYTLDKLIKLQKNHRVQIKMKTENQPVQT